MVLGKARMQGEIVHAPLPSVEHFGYSNDRLRIQFTFPHNPQSAGSFGNQDPAIGKESKSIRVAETQQGNDSEFWSGDLGTAGASGAAVKNQGLVQHRGLDDNVSLRSLCRARLKDSNSQNYNSYV